MLKKEITIIWYKYSCQKFKNFKSFNIELIHVWERNGIAIWLTEIYKLNGFLSFISSRKTLYIRKLSLGRTKSNIDRFDITTKPIDILIVRRRTI